MIVTIATVMNCYDVMIVSYVAMISIMLANDAKIATMLQLLHFIPVKRTKTLHVGDHSIVAILGL